jgi:sugar/nucleoside kinase (ribokinase family)
MLDVVVASSVPPQRGTDVAGTVGLRQGGSAASTARWLARLGLRVDLVCAVGRDPIGRSLVRALASDGVRVRATRIAAERTGRVGVIVGPDGERSFVADRGAADRLAAADLERDWFATDLLHLPAYSLLGQPLGEAGREAIRLARGHGALVSLDLASSGPLLAGGRADATELVRSAGPDVLFATAGEAEALLAHPDPAGLAVFAPLVVIKRGPLGASVYLRSAGPAERFDVATAHVAAVDTTGAGDAFDAGFLAAWLATEPGRRGRPAALHRAVLTGHRMAMRQLTAKPRELALG